MVLVLELQRNEKSLNRMAKKKLSTPENFRLNLLEFQKTCMQLCQKKNSPVAKRLINFRFVAKLKWEFPGHIPQKGRKQSQKTASVVSSLCNPLYSVLKQKNSYTIMRVKIFFLFFQILFECIIQVFLNFPGHEIRWEYYS